MLLSPRICAFSLADLIITRSVRNWLARHDSVLSLGLEFTSRSFVVFKGTNTAKSAHNRSSAVLIVMVNLCHYTFYLWVHLYVNIFI